MGWLGWTEEQALGADVNAILVAHSGRLSMFEAAGWIKRGDPEDDLSNLPEAGPGMFGRR